MCSSPKQAGPGVAALGPAFSRFQRRRDCALPGAAGDAARGCAARDLRRLSTEAEAPLLPRRHARGGARVAGGRAVVSSPAVRAAATSAVAGANTSDLKRYTAARNDFVVATQARSRR